MANPTGALTTYGEREQADIARSVAFTRATPAVHSDVREVRVGWGRPTVRGRFLEVDGKKLYVRGVTYGTFRDDEQGVPYPDPATVEADFAAMAQVGLNAVRLYSSPPIWLLDLAHAYGLRAMVGLAWEQHIAFLDDRRRAARILDQVEREAEQCAGHPALLCYAVGNEIPSSIVRWYGNRRIERFVGRLCSRVKRVDSQALVSYVNYPSTEYLQLPFLDVVCFNVYLEKQEALDAYLPRLHNLAGDRPLLIAELGLDSASHGEHVQARGLARQLASTYASGCAGAFVFSWTDEWHRGGVEVEDWRFGLVDRRRRPKPALRAVEGAFDEVPLRADTTRPQISVVVCTHNGAATIATCLNALCRLDYNAYEVIVVDDGSTDRTAEIVADFGVRLIGTENRGLSNARNVGIEAASGEIVAFVDDDAWPDSHWLQYLAHAFASSDHVGIGGPNIPPETGKLVERAVACAPGGPMHVLLSDEIAEHIPGCNMAFRKDALQAIGGFDPQFRIAGDDVDICWRLQEQGWTIGFSPGATVEHKRRGSLRAYLKQQLEYGKAEALLERKWPAKYNRGGHLRWAGRMYGSQLPRRRGRSRIGYGTWGSNLFQSIYDRPPGTIGGLITMPEWYLLLGVLAVLSVVGSFAGPLVPWTSHSPVRVELALFVATWAALSLKAVQSAWHLPRTRGRASIAVRSLTTLLFGLQPLARLAGRLRLGLTPWRRRGEFAFAAPWPRKRQIWSEAWRSQSERLLELEGALLLRCMAVRRGGDFDRWDIHLRLGPLGGARLRIAVEEHGHGRQLVRIRIWPRLSRLVPILGGLAGVWLAGALRQHLPFATALAALLAVVVFRALEEAGAGVALILDTIESRLAIEPRSMSRAEAEIQPRQPSVAEQPL